MIYYLIGQPGSGKTTIAKGIMKRYDFTEWYYIDGDDIRELFDNKDYSKDGRMKNIQLAQQLSQYLHSRGKKVLVSLVSPYKDQRDAFKRKMGSDLLEIYVHTSEIRGRENFFVQDYEPPTENYIDVCTDNITIEECIDKIMDLKL